MLVINTFSSIASFKKNFMPLCDLFATLHTVGDLHGDLDQTRCALEMAGVLSSDGEDSWTGGETVKCKPLIWSFSVVKLPSFGEHDDKSVLFAT